MNQKTEDIVAGLCCKECGVYFEEEHGYPVLCITCWESYLENPPLPLATNKEL